MSAGQDLIVTVLVGVVAASMIHREARADIMQVTIENTQSENTQSSGAFSFTPFWITARNGQFNAYDGDSPVPAFLTTLAELGDSDYLDSFRNTDTANRNTNTANCATISSTFGYADLVAHNTVAPESTSALILGAGGPVILRHRRKISSFSS